MRDKQEIGEVKKMTKDILAMSKTAAGPQKLAEGETYLPETLDVAASSNAWTCPFCGNLNGIPEITVCKCGARREGTTATK